MKSRKGGEKKMMKAITTVVAAAMVFAMVGSAQAYVWTMPSNDISIENEHTNVVTVSKANVDTGSVMQIGSKFAYASTGDVYGVASTALSQVNMTKFGGCNCVKGDVKIENERTNVVTVAKVSADTGKVSQVGFGSYTTGKTGSVTYVNTDAASVVNYTDFSVGSN